MTDAREYGKALFMLTEEVGSTEKVKSDIELLLGVIKANPEYTKLLDTPAIPKDERLKLVDEAFSSIDRNLLSTVKILIEKRMSHSIKSACQGFNEAYDEDRGIERVEAVSAIPMTEKQLETLKLKLEKITNKQIIIRNTVDKTILGGIKLRYMGIQLDGSLKTKLEKLENAIKNTVV